MLLRTLIVTSLFFSYFQEIFIDAWVRKLAFVFFRLSGCIVLSAFFSQPTLRVTILNYTQTYDTKYVEYSMVPTNMSGDYDVNLNVLRDNINPIVKLGIYFEDVEFMNKTINVCKVARSKNAEPLLKLIFRVLTDNDRARQPKQCPVKKVG